MGRANSLPPETNTPRYSPSSEAVAREIAVTPTATMTTDQRWVEETAATMRLLSDSLDSAEVAQILDFGVGPGRFLPELLRRWPGAQITAVDSSAQMLRFAAANVPPSNSGRVRFTTYQSLGELRETLGERRMDLALCIYVLQHVERELLPGIVDALHRSIKPGGHLFVINLVTRSVPSLLPSELTAADRDRTIHDIADHQTGSEDAWKDDGVDVMDLLTRKFGSVRRLEFPPVGFSRQTIERHFTALYQRQD